jgi:hypothetical protein
MSVIIKSRVNTKKTVEVSIEQLYNNIDKKISLNKKAPTFYECVSDVAKGYVDFECYLGDEENLEINRDMEIGGIRDALVDYDYEYDIFDASGIDSKGKKKVSFRIIFTNLVFNSGLDMREFVKGLELGEYVDYSVYKKQAGKAQLLRLPYTKKEGDQRIFKMVDCEDEIVEWDHITQDMYARWITQNVEGCDVWESKQEAEVEAEPEAEPEVEPEAEPEAEPEVDPEAIAQGVGGKEYTEGELKDLIGLLKWKGQTWEWQEWRNFVWCLRNISDEYDIDLRPICHEVSKEFERYDEVNTNKIYDVSTPLSPPEKKITLGSLIYWVKKVNPDGLKEWFRKTKIRDDYLTGDYYWYDFVDYIKNNVFGSFYAFQQYFEQNINRVMIMPNDMPGWYIRKISADNMFCMDKKLPLVVISFKTIEKERKKGENGQTIIVEKEVIRIAHLSYYFNKGDASQKLKNFDKLDFVPRSVLKGVEEQKGRKFNSWAGFQAKYIEEVDKKLLEPLLQHIFIVWCNKEQLAFNWIISWFRQIFIDPTTKNGTAIILKSGQGSGKGIIIDFLIKYVFGKRLGSSFSGLSNLTCRFNSSLMDKLFINPDELSAQDGSYHNDFDTMKKIITDPTISIEIKGGKKFDHPNFMNILGTTNHEHTIKIENSDRRYYVVECSDEFVGNIKYFEKLYKSLNQETADHFISWVVNFKDVVAVRVAPLTKIKEEMCRASLTSVERFMLEVEEEFEEQKELEWGGFTGLKKKILSEGEGWVSSNKVYSIYVSWCEENGEKKLSSRMFSKFMKKKYKHKRSNGSKFKF